MFHHESLNHTALCYRATSTRPGKPSRTLQIYSNPLPCNFSRPILCEPDTSVLPASVATSMFLLLRRPALQTLSMSNQSCLNPSWRDKDLRDSSRAWSNIVGDKRINKKTAAKLIELALLALSKNMSRVAKVAEGATLPACQSRDPPSSRAA